MNLLNSTAQGGNQFVTFVIGSEEYGIEIKAVQEITAYRPLTHLPNTPSYVKGILNLRGNVIPIMDPRIKFGLPEVEHTKSSVIIIFKTQGRIIGMIVDKISDVITIEKKNIEETPDVSIDINTKFIDGIGKVADKFVIVLNIDKIFSKEEIEVGK
jgi:purine-binding chemotaxis protein CheW